MYFWLLIYEFMIAFPTASLGICRDTNSSNMETESSLVVQLVTDDNASV